MVAHRRAAGLAERLLWGLVALGLAPRAWPGSACGTVILEVKGRRSGRLHARLVTWVEREGERYLVQMPAREPGWVSNVRAAGGTAVLRHGGRRDEVRLEELPPSERAPVLRAWYAFTAASAVPRRHFELDRRAPIDEFERLARAHPVFRIVSAGTSAATARRVTRDVESAAVGHLLEDPPRATVAFGAGDVVEALPARVSARGDRHLFGIVRNAAPDLHGREVLLVVDGGTYWFELCGMSVRGVAERVHPPEPQAQRPLRWYAVAPRRILAWDYAAVREV